MGILCSFLSSSRQYHIGTRSKRSCENFKLRSEISTILWSTSEEISSWQAKFQRPYIPNSPSCRFHLHRNDSCHVEARIRDVTEADTVSDDDSPIAELHSIQQRRKFANSEENGEHLQITVWCWR